MIFIPNQDITKLFITTDVYYENLRILGCEYTDDAKLTKLIRAVNRGVHNQHDKEECTFTTRSAGTAVPNWSYSKLKESLRKIQVNLNIESKNISRTANANGVALTTTVTTDVAKRQAQSQTDKLAHKNKVEAAKATTATINATVAAMATTTSNTSLTNAPNVKWCTDCSQPGHEVKDNYRYCFKKQNPNFTFTRTSCYPGYPGPFPV